MKPRQEILTAAEVSKWLRIPKSTLYKLCADAQIPCAKIGKHWRFDKKEIHNWFQKKMGGKQVTGHRKDDDSKARSVKFQMELMKGLNTILESTPFGILIVGEDKKIRLVNKKYLELMSAKSEKDLIHNSCSTNQKNSPLQNKEKVNWSEKNLIICNGKPVPLLRSVVPITIGKESVLLETLIDIPEHNQGKVGLSTAKEQSETFNQAKRELFSSLSHKLRTPLGHIIGFTEIVIDKDCGKLNETQEEFLNDSLKSAYHLLDMLNGMLDYSKLEAGGV